MLAVAFLLEGYSLRTGLKQARGEADRFGVPLRRYLRHTPDTAVKAVVLEDSAALVGLVARARPACSAGSSPGPACGTASPRCASALLLVYVAWVLGHANAELLIGRPLPKEMRQRIREEMLASEHVEAVLELTTLVQGPSEALVAAKVDFRDTSTAAQIEWACEQAERRLRARFPARDAGSTWTRRRVSRSGARRASTRGP